MMRARIVLLAVGLVTVCSASFKDYDDYKAWLQSADNNVTVQQDFQKHLHLFQSNTQQSIFPCEPFPPSKTTPTSVHRLRPGDIQVVAAMGDSITAGTGITAATIVALLRQDRGLSWSIGGDGDYAYQPTIPNILRKYNPKIKGFAVKSGSADSRNARLDVAVPGAKAEDMVEQAKSLIQKMKTDHEVDFKNDWKLITIFIGGNDLCDYCEDTRRYNASNYVLRVQQALDILHDNIPRAFVNLVLINHMDEVQKVNIGIVCSIAHIFLCRCGAYPGSREAAERLHQASDDYDMGLNKLINSGRYSTSDDFTVVIQPFFKDTKVPYTENRPDLSFLAPDCFHFSRKGHAAAAIALWNNMIHPAYAKRSSWVPGQTPDCPNMDNPYLSTSQNSPSIEGNDGNGFQISIHISIG